MRRSAGFTLIEVMVAVAIIGILASVALVSYLNFTTKAADNACLAEARGHVSRVMVALTNGHPAPSAQLAACQRITLAGDNKTLTAFPARPGKAGVLCDLDSSGRCVISVAITE